MLQYLHYHPSMPNSYKLLLFLAGLLIIALLFVGKSSGRLFAKNCQDSQTCAEEQAATCAKTYGELFTDVSFTDEPESVRFGLSYRIDGEKDGACTFSYTQTRLDDVALSGRAYTCVNKNSPDIRDFFSTWPTGAYIADALAYCAYYDPTASYPDEYTFTEDTMFCTFGDIDCVSVLGE